MDQKSEQQPAEVESAPPYNPVEARRQAFPANPDKSRQVESDLKAYNEGARLDKAFHSDSQE